MEAISTHPRLDLIPLNEGVHQQSFAAAVRDGFKRSPKRLPCRFLYDESGSDLFEQICALPEYYPTRTEAALLARHADHIVAHVPENALLSELGSGSATKTRHLIDAFMRRQEGLIFIPIDISPTMLEASSTALIASYHALEITAIAAEYQRGLRYLRDLPRAKLIAWLGGNVGNLTRPSARAFLERVRGCMHAEDRLLMGIDLMKSTEVLLAAYNDSRGVTAAFNKNLLTRINKELGGEFDLDHFRHEARFNAADGRIEMHLVSTRDQIIHITALNARVGFAEDETIHTENSHKYTPEQINALAAAAGFAVEERWLDDNAYFSCNLLKIKGVGAAGPPPRRREKDKTAPSPQNG